MSRPAKSRPARDSNVVRQGDPPRHPRLFVRPARPADAPELGRVGFRGFRQGTAEGWKTYFTDNPHAPPDATLVAEIDGVIAGHATALQLTMSLAGADVPVRGVAAVAVAPEYRRRGVADTLMREHLRRMKKRGEALSLLYPFKQSFYRKFGYEVCEHMDHVRAAPALLPASPLRRHVRQFDAERDGPQVMALYEATRAGTSGLLVRTSYWWKTRVWKRTPDGAVYVDPATGRVRGALQYDVPTEPGYPRQHLHVRDLVAADASAFRGLLGFLQAYGEQVQLVQLPLPRGQGLSLLSDRPDLAASTNTGILEPAAYLSVGAMGRIVDLAGALALHPGPARSGVRGRIGLDLADPVIPANSRGFDVTFGARGATVTPGGTARDRLAIGVDRLAQVYFGAASTRLLRAQGFATGSPRAAALLDTALAGPPLYLGPANFF